MSNIMDKFVMPEFSIDTVVDSNTNHETPGIKRMYDIALAIQDSIMVWGGPGCIVGDAKIRGHWNGKVGHNYRKGVAIENIYKHQHDITYKGSYQIKSKEFVVKSYNEALGIIEDTTVTSTYSGKKVCYRITTENGRSVEATEEHPLFTGSEWVEVRNLKVGDTIYTYPTVSKDGFTRTKSKPTVKYQSCVSLKYHPNAQKKTQVNNNKECVYYLKRKYILEYEANVNNMSYKDYIKALNEHKTEGLYFVPKGMELHHINRDRSDNSIDNIKVLTTAEHAALHTNEDKIVNVIKPVATKIVSIEKTGLKDTYDLTCDKNHNFFADDILVHNCGKSQAVQQWNAEKVEEYNKRIAEGEKIKPWNPEVCDVRLSMKEPVDMVGVPIPTKNEKGEMVTVWATPSMWPKTNNEYSGGVIHLDEMNQGQAAILNAAFQLIQDRALGEYKVPNGYLIIASSNPPAFNATVTDLSIPLSNRFSHFNVKANFESWLNHKMNNKGNLDVMTFLKTQGPDMLYDKETMEKRIGSDATALYTDIVVTPRSWEVIERLVSLPAGDKASGGFTLDEKHAYATGRLGLALATKFFKWLKDKEKYQSWKEILVEGKPFRDESIDGFWTTQMACIATINGTESKETCREYVLNFIKASNQLKSRPYKVINLTSLVNSKRLQGALDLFNPMKDCPEILKLASAGIS